MIETEAEIKKIDSILARLSVSETHVNFISDIIGEEIHYSIFNKLKAGQYISQQKNGFTEVYHIEDRGRKVLAENGWVKYHENVKLANAQKELEVIKQARRELISDEKLKEDLTVAKRTNKFYPIVLSLSLILNALLIVGSLITFFKQEVKSDSIIQKHFIDTVYINSTAKVKSDSIKILH